MTKIVDFIRNKISDKAMAIMGVALLGTYYFVGLLSYITVPIKPIYRVLTSSSMVAIILRALMCAFVCLFCIVIVIKYKQKIKWGWLVIFCFVLFMTLISILISPMTYEYMFSESLYKVVHIVLLNPGIPKTIVMYLSSVADFAFAFCILFIMPTVINDKKKLLFILLPIVAIGLFECCYSLVVEKENYLYLLNHPDDPFGGYNNDIGATFGNKEDWGAFLTVSFVSAVASIFFLKKAKKTIIVKIGLSIAAVTMSVFAVLSLCKTAMLAIGLCCIMLLIGGIVMMAKKSKIRFWIAISLSVVLVGLIATFFATKGFGVQILNKVYNFFHNFIINRAEHAVEGRTSLWLNYMENIRGYNLFFGMGKSYVSIYTKMLVPETQSTIHNGFVYFFASYGLVGFLLFVALLLLVIRNIICLWRINNFYVFLFIGILLAGISFVLAEAEVLIISSSTPIFIFNLLTVILPAGLLIKKKKEQEAR